MMNCVDKCMQFLVNCDSSVIRPRCTTSEQAEELNEVLMMIAESDATFISADKKERSVRLNIAANRLLDDASAFNAFLRDKYGCLLEFVEHAARGLNVDQVNIVTSSSSDPYPIPTSSLRAVICQGIPQGSSLWSSLFADALTKVVFLACPALPGFTEQAARLALAIGVVPTVVFVPLVRIEPDVLALLEEFAAATGGGVVPFAYEPSTIKDAIMSFSSADNATERKRYYLKRPGSFKFIESQSSLMTLINKWVPSASVQSLCLPQPETLSALSDVSGSASFRWTRGLRLVRQSLGVRDATFADPGEIGLQLEPGSWTVLTSTPPASALDIAPGTRLLAIQGVAIDKQTHARDIAALLRRRPLVLTFGEVFNTDLLDAFIGQQAQEIAASVLNDRAKAPYTAIPKPIKPRSIKLHAQFEGRARLSADTWARIVMFAGDLKTLVSVSSLNKEMHHAFIKAARKRKSPGWRVLKFLIRNGACSLMSKKGVHAFINWLLPPVHAGLDVLMARLVLSAGFDVTHMMPDLRELHPLSCLERDAVAVLKNIVDTVTPALFAVNARIARRLRAEGVALELLFIRWLLSLIWQPQTDYTIRALLILEGPLSMLWLRVFVLSITRLPEASQGLSDATRIISDMRMDSAIIAEASLIPLTRTWMNSWMK